MRAIARLLVLSLPAIVAAAAPARAREFTGRTVSVNGVELYHEVGGSGPPLLLLHRFGGCGAA